MAKNILTKYFLSLTSLVLLVGCGPDPLGLNVKRPPDEFMVTTRAPLEVPSEFKLVKPQPGMTRPQEKGTKEMALEGVFGQPVQLGAATQNPEDQTFVRQFAVSGIDPSIRQKVNQEAKESKVEISSIAETIMFWKDTKTMGIETIDPVEEAQKLKEKGILTKGTSRKTSTPD